FLLVTFFDTAGTLVGLAQQAGFMKDNKMPRVGKALLTEPTNIALESDSKALPTRDILLSFMKPACCAKPTNVPAVSKNLTNKKVITTTTNCIVLISVTCLIA